VIVAWEVLDQTMVQEKIGFGLLWVGFVTYAFLLAPPDQPDTFELIKNLSTGGRH